MVDGGNGAGSGGDGSGTDGSGADDGGITVEYVLLVMFIAVAIAVALFVLGNEVLELFNKGVEMPWDGLPD